MHQSGEGKTSMGSWKRPLVERNCGGKCSKEKYKFKLGMAAKSGLEMGHERVWGRFVFGCLKLFQ